jgi:hypothetical protein
VLLGDGVRLYDAVGGRIRRLLLEGPKPTRTVDLRYRPAGRVAAARAGSPGTP